MRAVPPVSAERIGVPGDLTASPRALERVRRNAALFEQMADVAARRAADRRFGSALEWCRAAAGFAVTNGTGRLRSVRLESIVDLVAEQALATVQAPARSRTGGLRVLHLLSEAAQIGGLTRLAERWIRHDTGSVSSVAVTRQAEVIDALVDAAHRSGGWARALDGDRDPIRAAGQLRRLAADVDVVVCHPGVDDVILGMAFGRGYAGPPVALFNHTDHLFSLIPTRTSLVVDFRSVGSRLTREVRGYGEEVTFELPLLVPAHDERSTSRPADLLPRTPDQVVAMTLARAQKFYDTPLRPRFSELVAEALDRNRDLVLCAVGPEATEEPWPALMRRYPGRVLPTGPVRDPRPYLEAADLYLDTFPFSSLTSLLEASALGLPVLTFDGHEGYRRTLGIADFVPDPVDRPRSLRDWNDRLATLVDSPAARREGGDRARHAYRCLTPVGQWEEQVGSLYAALLDQAERGRVVGTSGPPPPDESHLDYGCAISAIEPPAPLLWRMTSGLPRFDARDRRSQQARTLIVRAARKAAVTVGLPPWQGAQLLLPRAGSGSRVTS